MQPRLRAYSPETSNFLAMFMAPFRSVLYSPQCGQMKSPWLFLPAHFILVTKDEQAFACGVDDGRGWETYQ